MAKSVLIFGGSRGIGAATALYFAEKGYKVAITYNNSGYAAKIMQQNITANGGEFIVIPCDVTSSVQVDSAIKQAVSAFGRLDAVINNAGIAEQKLITDVTDTDWQKMLNTNLSGVFYACRSAAKVMVNQKNGSIVNVSSIWGITGASCEVAYSATKAGIIGLTKALAKELGPSNVRVNCVAPGVIDTEMNSNLDIGALADLADETPLGRIGTTEEVAKAIYYLANDADFITGQVLSPNGGIVV
ncbi:MAG: 3-oxoacyl-ACP reductase FabG [Clostridia bacterium]|nr:3-oxoacyl-ACP reductase FabG [Clostridia bacterium]